MIGKSSPAKFANFIYIRITRKSFNQKANFMVNKGQAITNIPVVTLTTKSGLRCYKRRVPFVRETSQEQVKN